MGLVNDLKESGLHLITKNAKPMEIFPLSFIFFVYAFHKIMEVFTPIKGQI